VTERITLPADTAAELIEMFEFCCDWFDHDRSRLDDSLGRYTAGGYGLAQLREDLRRFADTVGHAPRTGNDEARR
jgi:hypothetical protein